MFVVILRLCPCARRFCVLSVLIDEDRGRTLHSLMLIIWLQISACGPWFSVACRVICVVSEHAGTLNCLEEKGRGSFSSYNTALPNTRVKPRVCFRGSLFVPLLLMQDGVLVCLACMLLVTGEWAVRTFVSLWQQVWLIKTKGTENIVLS